MPVPLLDAAGRHRLQRPCRAIIAGGRRATRACAIPTTRHELKRSSPSCDRPATPWAARGRGGGAPPLRAAPAAPPHAVELAHEGVPLNVSHPHVQHAHLGVTSIYLQGIDNAEIIATVHTRHAPMTPAGAGLALPRPTR